MPPPELHSSQDMLAWKREYNIRQREADWKRRQEEALTQKQVMWQIERCERDNRLVAARELRRKSELEERVYKRHLEIDRKYKERCREAEIEKKEQSWTDRENDRLIDMHQVALEERTSAADKRALEKSVKFEEMRTAAAERAEKLRRDKDLNQKRLDSIRAKEIARTMKAADNAKSLKNDDIAKSGAIVAAFVAKTVGGGGSHAVCLVAERT